MRNFLWLFIIAGCLSSCFKESDRGQYPIEDVPPGPVSSPQVENLPGAAIISYAIPEDEDLLYVKAVYTLDNGEVVEQKASAYTNKLKIEGIGRSREVDVKLICGDRSKNESEPVVVKAHPLDASIYNVFETLHVQPDFGGIRISWENKDEADVVISVTTPDDFGNMVTADNFYTKSKKGEGSIRGYESKERLFAISIHDRWGNVTDTLQDSYLPLFEERIEPKDHFVRWNPFGIPYTQYSDAYSIEKIWDDNPATRYLFFTSVFPASFTFDMGQTAIFSRIQAFMDVSQLFRGQAIESFEIWGSPTADVTDDLSKGWVMLGDYRFTRPSENGGSTQEDDAAGLAGEDFSVDPAAPPVRYIRVIVKKTWGNSQYVTLGDLRFWGQIK